MSAYAGGARERVSPAPALRRQQHRTCSPYESRKTRRVFVGACREIRTFASRFTQSWAQAQVIIIFIIYTVSVQSIKVLRGIFVSTCPEICTVASRFSQRGAQAQVILLFLLYTYIVIFIYIVGAYIYISLVLVCMYIVDYTFIYDIYMT